MKNLILSLSLAAIASGGFAVTASAQRYQERVAVERYSNERYNDPRYTDNRYEEERYDGPRISISRGRDVRIANDLNRLNREVQIVRQEIRAAGLAGRRVRRDFFRVERATERLNDHYRRGSARGWEIRRRADEIRSDLHQIRRELRVRSIRPVGWR